MATINVVPRSSKTDEDGTVPLYLRISHKSKNRFISLGHRIKEKHWNPNKQKVRKSHPKHSSLNRYLSEIKTDAQGALVDLKSAPHPVTAQRLKKAVRRELKDAPSEESEEASGPEHDFLDFCEQLLSRYRKRGQYSTFKTYRNEFRKFRTYLREQYDMERLPYEAFSVSLMEEFGPFCADYFQNSTNTVYKAMKTIRTFVRKAIKEGHLPQAENPFFQIELTRTQTRKKKLAPEEIERIEELDLEQGSRIWDVRHWFLFAFYGGGLRFSDVATLRNEHIKREDGRWRLAYEMEKTGGLAGSMLPTPAVEILIHYYEPTAGEDALVFNILEGYDLSTPEKKQKAIESRTSLANKYLKKIQDRADIETRISTHLARHSIADYVRKEGWSVYDISKLLRHSNISTTERYLAGFDRDGLDAKIEELF